jgi:hypothetical protein
LELLARFLLEAVIHHVHSTMLRTELLHEFIQRWRAGVTDHAANFVRRSWSADMRVREILHIDPAPTTLA